MSKVKEYLKLIIFLVILVAGLFAAMNQVDKMKGGIAIVASVVYLVMGFVLLIKGADYFVDGASGIASKFGIPQIIIGLTIVAFGTSAPEAAVSISSGFKGAAGLAVGNVLGSNVMNVLLILGLAATITNLKVGVNTIWIEIPFVIIITGVLLVMGIINGENPGINKACGLILWGFFIIFFIYLIISAKNGKDALENDEESEHKVSLPVALLAIYVIAGMVAIVAGSNVTVDSASFIASKLGVTDRIIGLTVVAFGTSLPELVTSCIAAKKGNADIAIGNIVGSNIFNILFVLGTTALVMPLKGEAFFVAPGIAFAKAFIFDGIAAIYAAVLLLLCCFKKKQLGKIAGIVMLVSYAIYFLFTIGIIKL